MKGRSKFLAQAAVCAFALAATDGAKATEGYILGGYGATQASLSGAGVANSTDAMAMTLNPAGLVDVDRQFQIGLSLFAPTRSYDASGTLFVAPGNHDSSIPYFLMPNVAYSQPIDPTSAWGVALYGNGGMNTYYRSVTNFGFLCPGANGVYCGAATGVNLSQIYFEAAYAKSYGPLSIGFAPVVAMQMFSAEGLGAFRSYSAYPYAMTNNGGDNSFGVGLHAGIQWKVTPAFRIGLAGATPTWMQNLSKYKGLFANQGSFDIPGYVTTGVAWDVVPTITLMADYKAIFYSGVPAIADPSNVRLPFGATNGPGFGWSNVNVIAVGGEWRATPQLTLRAGFEYNNNPVHGRDVTLNLVAPGVTTSQISAGLTYRVTPNSSIDLAGYYCPKGRVSGPEVTPFGPTPFSNITASLSEAQVTIGWTYHFGAEEPAPVRAKF
jgi:long-chain fatty acid transport protein